MADDVDNSKPGDTYFYSYLYDRTTGFFLYNARQESVNTADAAFVLGGAAGDTTNYFTGKLTGTLTAGHTYELFHGAFTNASPDSDGGARATGYLSLGINGPAAPPPVAPLPSVVSSGFALMALLTGNRLRVRSLKSA